MLDRFAYESSLYNSGAEYVVGVDEVGRGPLAGPVVAAAVVFKNSFADEWWDQIKDSKKVSETKRTNLAELISANSLSTTGVASVEEIERLNILQASLLAMQRAVESLAINLQAAHILVDGKFLIPDLLCKEQRAIVNGDAQIHSIAAASILAKVTRDNMMGEYSQQYPEYNFAQHKGYGTSLHINAIKRYGLSPIHRASFCGNIL